MRKIISIMIVMFMMLSISVTAFAAECKPVVSVDSYQEILDKLNKEYGTNVHFATENERSELGIKDVDITVSLEEFESQMRKDIEASIKANEDALNKSKRLNSVKIEESGSGICGKASFSSNPKSSSTVTQSKDVAGATAYLSATVNNSSYWYYSSISSVWTTYLAGYNSTPAFVATAYNYSLIDARRTCAVSLYGYTIGNWGVIIDNNAYRYVEFRAGSGM